MYLEFRNTNHRSKRLFSLIANDELKKKIWLARACSLVRLKMPKISQSSNPSTKISQELKVPESIQFGFPEVNSLISSIFHVDHSGKYDKLSEEILDDLNKLIASVPRFPVTGLEEQLKTETRQTWLKQIDCAIEQSTISMKSVYKSVFEVRLHRKPDSIKLVASLEDISSVLLSKPCCQEKRGGKEL